MTQTDRVLAALTRAGAHGITQVDFLLPDVIDGGPPITRVPARIKELKDNGFSVHYAGSRDKCRVYRLLESFYKVDPDTGCWLWTGSTNPATGYGKVGDTYAHRLVYGRAKGPIPAGYDLDHLCRNPPCVNPDHLEPVTHTENIRRGAATKLTREQVAEVLSSQESAAALARRFGVHPSNVSRIRTGENWAPEATVAAPASPNPIPATDPAHAIEDQTQLFAVEPPTFDVLCPIRDEAA